MLRKSVSANRVVVVRWALAVCPALVGAGCVFEPYQDTVQVPRPTTAPAYHWPATTRGVDGARGAGAQVPVWPVSPPTPGAVLASMAGATAGVAAGVGAPPVPVDEKTRDQIGQAARDALLKRYPAVRDPKLNDYLLLVGSLVTLGAPKAEAEFQFVLLETDQVIAGSAAPRTIVLSRGLLDRMEDESELAGVLAREMANLATGRTLSAAGYALAGKAGPATQSTTAQAAPLDAQAVRRAGQAVADVILKDTLGTELDQAADLDGARLAAAARYAPDGYLRLLSRVKPGTPNSAEWARVKALDANVAIVTKSHPGADVRLPVRFEEYVKK